MHAQMMSSALVATQVDAGSAGQVPTVLEQLRDATEQGQLQVGGISSCKQCCLANCNERPCFHSAWVHKRAKSQDTKVLAVQQSISPNDTVCLSATWQHVTSAKVAIADIRHDLQGAMKSQGLQVSSLQLQAATAVVPTPASTGGTGLSVPFIVGIIVAGAVALLCIFGAAYFGLFRCCMPASKRVAEEEQKGASRSVPQNDVKPFFECPKFQQTYPRPPSLVAQSNPAFHPGRPPRHPRE